MPCKDINFQYIKKNRGHQRIRTAVAAFAELSLTTRPGDLEFQIGCKYRAFFCFMQIFFHFSIKFIYNITRTNRPCYFIKLPIILRGCCFCFNLANKMAFYFSYFIDLIFIKHPLPQLFKCHFLAIHQNSYPINTSCQPNKKYHGQNQ